jgi:prevent-host-death family protein
MSLTLTVTELVRNFADYLNRVAYRGEKFRLTRGGKPVAELGPVAFGRSLRDLPDLIAGLPPLSEKEAEAFGADLEQARLELADVAVHDRWTS